MIWVVTCTESGTLSYPGGFAQKHPQQQTMQIKRGDKAITRRITKITHIYMDYRTIKVTSTPISAGLGWLRDNETIPNIKIPKLPNFPLD